VGWTLFPQLLDFSKHFTSFEASSILQVKKWIRQIVLALSGIHSLGFAHMDIKEANLLLDAEGDVYVTDFEYSHWVKEAPYPAWGTTGGAEVK